MKPQHLKTQEEKAWWASLTPEERRMAKEEQAVEEMLPKIKIEFVAPKETVTPEEAKAGRDRLLDLFMNMYLPQAIGIMFAPKAEPEEHTSHGLHRSCVICQQSIWTGQKYRLYSGWAMHSECVERGLESKAHLEKREAFDKKWKELKAIRGEAEPERPGVFAKAEARKVESMEGGGVFERVLELAPGTVIPKPEAKGDFTVKGRGKRRGEEALIYFIPNQKGGKPYQKGITRSELEAAAVRLGETGSLTRSWFKEFLPACAKEGGCNFTTIGGLLELLGEAERGERGVYRRAGYR